MHFVRIAGRRLLAVSFILLLLYSVTDPGAIGSYAP